MKFNILKNHPNRRHHNWLIYDISDKFLKQNIPSFKGVVYNFGCGEDPYRKFFLKYTRKYVTIDWENSYHDIKADLLADLNEPLPIKSEIANTVFSRSVLEHLCEPQTMLNEAYRILQKRGLIILIVPWQCKIHEEPYDFFRYTPYGLKYMLHKAGFKKVIIIPSSGFFTMWFRKLNYFTARIVEGPKILKVIIGVILIPFWFLSQKISPALDKLDKNWKSETVSYFVKAEK